jgi:hypothetical protein
MLLHVVLFRPRAGLSDSERESMLTAMHAAANGIPSVRRFQVGVRVKFGANYESQMTQDFPFVGVIEFDNLAGLQEYLQHPLHDRLGEMFYSLSDGSLAYDYQAASEKEAFEP